MITSFALARIFTVESFGKLFIITSTTAMFASLAGLGLGSACTRHVAQLHRSDLAKVRRIISISLLAGFVASGIVTCAALWLAPYVATLLQIPELVLELRIACLLLVTDTILGIQIGILAGFEDFRKITKVSMIQACLSLPLTLVGVWGYGIAGALAATVLVSLTGVLLCSRAIRLRTGSRTGVYREPGSWSEAAVLWRLALPLTLAGIVVAPTMWLGNTLLARSAGSYGQLGIFNAAQQWRLLLFFLPSVFGNVLLSLTSTDRDGSNPKLHVASMLSGWILVTFPAVLIIIFPEITLVALGGKYAFADYNRCLALLMLLVCLAAYKDGIVRRMILDDLVWWGVLSNVIWAILFTLLLYYRPVVSAVHLAKVYLASQAVSTVLFVPFYVKKNLLSSRMVFSWESASVWLVICASYQIHCWNLPLLLRVPVYLVFTMFLCLMFFKMWRSSISCDGAMQINGA